jgi:hypothetical protein
MEPPPRAINESYSNYIQQIIFKKLKVQIVFIKLKATGSIPGDEPFEIMRRRMPQKST